MTSKADPVLLYDADAYVTHRDDLKGRHSAGEGFLSAFLAHASGPDVFALCRTVDDARQFEATVSASSASLRARVVHRTDYDILKGHGVLNLPYPDIAREARIRSFLGDASYAICGLTHTICTRSAIDCIADLLVAPVQPWDALICTSQAAHTAVSSIVAKTKADLEERLGVGRFVLPLLPIIPLGVHADRFSHQAQARAHWRAQLGLAETTIAVLFFGRLDARTKASPLQLAQATELAAQRTGFSFALLWCGRFDDDTDRRAFMQTAASMAPSVRLAHVDGRQDDTRFIWSAADIFCSLSDNLQETFGLTVIEAMAAGLPVIVSNWNGYRDFVRHGDNGILIDSYFAEQPLADAAYRYVSGADSYKSYVGGLSQFCFLDVGQTAEWLERLGADTELRKRLGSSATSTVKKELDWQKVIARYAALWDEQRALAAHGRGDVARRPSMTWKAIDPRENFRHYPSGRLERDAVLVAGPQFERWKDLLTEPGVVINANLLLRRDAFETVRGLFGRSGRLTVGDVNAAFPEAGRDLVGRSIYWLIKVGLLALASDNASHRINDA